VDDIEENSVIDEESGSDVGPTYRVLNLKRSLAEPEGEE